MIIRSSFKGGGLWTAFTSRQNRYAHICFMRKFPCSHGPTPQAAWKTLNNEDGAKILGTVDPTDIYGYGRCPCMRNFALVQILTFSINKISMNSKTFGQESRGIFPLVLERFSAFTSTISFIKFGIMFGALAHQSHVRIQIHIHV